MSYLGPAEIASSFSQDFCQSNKHDTFWNVVSTGYFCFFFFFSASDLCPLEIYEKLGLSLSSITFTANNHADNHFYQCAYLFQIIHNLESVFFFCIFPQKNTPDRKKRFHSRDYVKIIELHDVNM